MHKVYFIICSGLIRICHLYGYVLVTYGTKHWDVMFLIYIFGVSYCWSKNFVSLYLSSRISLYVGMRTSLLSSVGFV